MSSEPQKNITRQVTVLIAGRPYVLHVQPEDEALVHQFAQVVDDHVRRLRLEFPGRDVQDYLALALFRQAFNSRRSPDLSAFL